MLSLMHINMKVCIDPRQKGDINTEVHFSHLLLLIPAVRLVLLRSRATIAFVKALSDHQGSRK